PPFPSTTRFRSQAVVTCADEIKEQLSRFGCTGLPLPDQLVEAAAVGVVEIPVVTHLDGELQALAYPPIEIDQVRVDVIQNGMFGQQDRKSTRLNSSHVKISYAVFCL